MATRRIIYFSRCADGPSPEVVAEILAESRRNNERDGITGLLLHMEGVFAQVLEGPAAAIEETIARIEKDPRHHDMTVLSDGDVGMPLFQDWSMGYMDTDVSDLLSAAGLDGVEDAIRAFADEQPDAAHPVIDTALENYSKRLSCAPASGGNGGSRPSSS
jgi:hypothetical protein